MSGEDQSVRAAGAILPLTAPSRSVLAPIQDRAVCAVQKEIICIVGSALASNDCRQPPAQSTDLPVQQSSLEPVLPPPSQVEAETQASPAKILPRLAPGPVDAVLRPPAVRHHHGRRGLPPQPPAAAVQLAQSVPKLVRICGSATVADPVAPPATAVVSNLVVQNPFSPSHSKAVPAGKLLELAFENVPVHSWELAEALQDACVSYMREHPPLTSMRMKRKATNEGRFLNSASIMSRDISRVACKLVQLIPPSALIKSFGLEGMVELVAMGPSSILEMFMKICNIKQKSAIDGAFSAYAQLLAFAHGLNPSASLERISGLVASKFLSEANVAAAARSGQPLDSEPNQATSVEAGQTVGAVKRDGHTVIINLTSGLKLIESLFCVDIGARSSLFQASGQSTANPHKSQVHSASLFVMIHLEMMATKPTLSRMVRAAAAAFVLMGLSANRHIQLQRGSTLRERTQDGFVVGNSSMRKHPDSAKQKPVDWVFSLPGFSGSTDWFDPLLESLDGASTGRFLIRETDSPDGDPFQATVWLNSPMTPVRVTRMLRCLLTSEEGPHLSVEQAGIYGKSSFRHFLPEVAKARRISPLESRELGAWSGFSDESLGSDPKANLVNSGEVAAAKMPSVPLRPASGRDSQTQSVPRAS